MRRGSAFLSNLSPGLFKMAPGARAPANPALRHSNSGSGKHPKSRSSTKNGIQDGAMPEQAFDFWGPARSLRREWLFTLFLESLSLALQLVSRSPMSMLSRAPA
jgi:hypothetical protein